MNPNNETDRNRLFKAMEHSYRQLEPFRSLVTGLVEDYAGTGYGQATKPRQEILLNLMNQAVDAYTMSLVANRPRVMVSSRNPQLSYFSKHFQTAINNLIQEVEVEVILRQWVLDAFFCLGVVKVHMADSALVQMEDGLWMDPGSPAASNISLDNFVYDTPATRWDRVGYAADCYRIPFEDLKSDLYIPSVVSQLVPTSKHHYDDGDGRLENISRGFSTDEDEFTPMVDLMDVWVPRDQRIYTFPMESKSRFTGKFGPVADMPWDGPELGPYHLLSFNDVPENIMPTSPASHLAGLERLVNNLMRKQSRRARAHKRVHTYTPAGAPGAKNVQRSSDDEWREVQDNSEINTIEIGGISPQTQAFMLGTVEMFDRMAGNLSAMMGLGPQAGTLGQEQLIYGAVSKKEAQMQYRVLDATRRLVRDMSYMLWHDVAKVIPGQIPIEGAEGYSVDATWTPEDREGDFFDYELDIDVYSMPYQSPSQRVQAMNTLLTQIYVPLAPMLMQQGGTINLQKLTEIYAELLNQPALSEVVQFGTPMMPGAGTETQGPASTSREYVRRNVPTGGTAQSRAKIQQSEWMDSGQATPAQMDSLANSA